MSSIAAEPALEATGARDFGRRFLRNRSAMIGAVIVLAVALVALAAPWIAPVDYRRTNMAFVWEAPGEDFTLGTDQLGRDILSRIIVGARVSLIVAMSVLAIAMVTGVAVGMAGGVARRLDRRAGDARRRHHLRLPRADHRDPGRGDARPRHPDRDHLTRLVSWPGGRARRPFADPHLAQRAVRRRGGRLRHAAGRPSCCVTACRTSWRR